MTLIEAILKKVKSNEGLQKYPSPPPEKNNIKRKRKKIVHKYADIRARVDTSPPVLQLLRWYRNLEHWRNVHRVIHVDNLHLLLMIRKAQFKGKVDSHWSHKPRPVTQYFQNRVDFSNRVHRDNLQLYRRIISTKARVEPTSSHNESWRRNRRVIINGSNKPFVLFPPVPEEVIEDPLFEAPDGVHRPRVYMTLGIHNGAELGELCIELFTDVCPKICALFTDLLEGDSLGHGYVGTYFFRKVPHLYWSGGDVFHNNGFGCYVQKGRREPIGAENYHFPHSMRGLLSMRVTRDNEVCGIFNITFKSLPQFDLHNVVFGRIIRPSNTYNAISQLGNGISTYPLIEVRSTRRRRDGGWVTGERNAHFIVKDHFRKLMRQL